MSSTPSPATDESSSEKSDLRALVDEAIAKERHAQAAMSPRSALLSHSSLRSGPHSNPSEDLYNKSSDLGGQLRKRSKGKRRQRNLEVARPSVLSQLLDVNVSRKDPAEEVARLRQILKTIERQAVAENKRARDLERANREVQQHFLELRENKLFSDTEAEKARQEARLFQYQLQNAEREIARNQAVVKSVEKQRDEAEAAAARARSKARKLREEHLMLAAREEGRRLGFEAGFEHARIESEMIAARKKSRRRVAPIQASASRIDKGKGKERTYPQGEEEQIVRPIPERVQNPQQSHRQFDDIESSPDSPSKLPMKNFADDQNLSRPQSQATSVHAFRPPQPFPQSQPPIAQPPESELPLFPPIQQSQPIQVEPLRTRSRQSFFPQQPAGLPRQEQPERQPPSQQPVVPGSQTPGVVIWTVDLPPASQISDNNSNPTPQKVVSKTPRDQWVTARKHHELTATPPQFEGGQPPALLPHPPKHKPTHITPSRGVIFSNIRPSLKKTKEQAFSWYRSFSQRRKNKAVIDPVPEEDANGAVDEPPVTTSTIMQSEPPSATEPPTTGVSSEMYGSATQPPSSWYQDKQPSGPPAPSIRSTDYAYSTSRRRPMSELDKMSTVSTRVSQFDLLATPDLGAQSVRNGKEGRRVKEKDGYLSAIREDPSSRDNTPNADRYLMGGGMPAMRSRTSIAQPDFRQPSLHQQPSYATMESQNRRRSRRPPSINPPEPDDALPPPGLAYDRHLQNSSAGGSVISGRQGYSNLSRKPSRISEKTTPDTSYHFDVIPPSGAVPEFVQSPPHTGVNHLSPYHTYRPPGPAGSPRIAPTQSVTSLRSQGGSRLAVPPFLGDRPGSATPSSRKSKQSLHVVNTDPSDPSAQAAVARPSSRASRAASASGTNGQYKNPPQTYSPRPERPASVKSSASKRPQAQPLQEPLSRVASQASLSPYPAAGGAGSSSGLVLEPPIHHRKSTTSLRSLGSFSKYNPDAYVDPAFWGPDGPGDDRPASIRPASRNSGLSYA